jgi:hypothetical protein
MAYRYRVNWSFTKHRGPLKGAVLDTTLRVVNLRDAKKVIESLKARRGITLHTYSVDYLDPVTGEAN